jgi:hypothetical protein
MPPTGSTARRPQPRLPLQVGDLAEPLTGLADSPLWAEAKTTSRDDAVSQKGTRVGRAFEKQTGRRCSE